MLSKEQVRDIISYCDTSAYRAAIVYSLLASCRAANVDPRQWLEHVLVEIPLRKKSGQPMDDLLPMEYDGIRWNTPESRKSSPGNCLTSTEQKPDKHTPNSAKKPEVPQPSDFFALFCQTVQYVRHRVLSIYPTVIIGCPKNDDSTPSVAIVKLC